MSTVLVLGGYGNAGSAITRLLLAHSDHGIRIAGRHPDRARALIDELGAQDAEWPARLEAVRVDASDRASLASALEGVDLIIAAAGTSRSAGTAVAAALSAGVDYLDIQVGHAKADAACWRWTPRLGQQG